MRDNAREWLVYNRLLSDWQGTVRDIADFYRTLRKHVDYDSFGKITGQQNYGAAIDELFGYTGQELDATTGLYNYNARWYDPRVGRFLSADPANDDVNSYRYVGNSAPNRTDPTGLKQAGNPLASLFSSAGAIGAGASFAAPAISAGLGTASSLYSTSYAAPPMPLNLLNRSRQAVSSKASHRRRRITCRRNHIPGSRWPRASR